MTGQSPDAEPEFPQHIGECIYCGSTVGMLSDEHVIPYGLHGNWVLRQASCRAHRDLTSELESDALRNAWAAARAALGLRTRRKKRRAEGFDITLEVPSGRKVVRVSAEAHPAPLAWPIYSYPGEWPSKPRFPGTSVVRVQTMIRTAKAAALMREYGASAVRYYHPDPVKFARFLGKIAYCFAVACNGVGETRESPLLGAVLQGGAQIFKYVGNEEGPSRFTVSDGQEVAMGANEFGRVVYIRLIPKLQPKEYIVCVDSPGAV